MFKGKVNVGYVPGDNLVVFTGFQPIKEYWFFKNVLIFGMIHDSQEPFTT